MARNDHKGKNGQKGQKIQIGQSGHKGQIWLTGHNGHNVEMARKAKEPKWLKR